MKAELRPGMVRRGPLHGLSIWYLPTPDGELPIAGYWYVFVAIPIFQFLLLRWIYRMVVWTRFLWQVSRLDLLLTPTHPDNGGIRLGASRPFVTASMSRMSPWR